MLCKLYTLCGSIAPAISLYYGWGAVSSELIISNQCLTKKHAVITNLKRLAY